MQSLSDKRIIVDEATEIDAEIVYFLRKDVKEFIRKLKKKCDVNINNDNNFCGLFESDIDELAGDKLIWNHYF